ncbi:hypothetical protein FBU30_002309, partial [Linnemannia zychae]
MIGLIKVYKVDDGNHTILSSLRSSISSETLNNIKAIITAQKPHKGIPPLTSLSEILNVLQDIEGPDSVHKRLAEDDGAKQPTSKHHKANKPSFGKTSQPAF